MGRRKKSVDPSAYSRRYYLTDCSGYEEFKKSYGQMLEPRLKEIVKYFKIVPSMKVLDVGCGRGELALFAAKLGVEAIGIDYSKEAIKIANLAKKKSTKEVQKRTKFHIIDAKNLRFKNSSFDIVILTDVIEHLYPRELDIVFKEVKRVLKRDGKIVVHTAPNKLFNDIGYKYYSYPVSTVFVYLWNLLLKKSYPNITKAENLRVDSHAIMHINEPTYFSLKKLYKKHKLEGSIISTNITAKKPVISFKDVIFNFFVFLHPISKRFPFNIIFGSDFVSILKNKE